MLKINKIKKKSSGFSLMETLVTIIIVGMLSAVCATMLIFAYSMFEKIMGSGAASIEYKMFRFKAERVFRNMTVAGPLIMEKDVLALDPTNTIHGGFPPDADQEEDSIKFDVEYFKLPYDGFVYFKKYTEVRDTPATTQYRYCTIVHDHADGAACSFVTDSGEWKNHVGRSVAVYSNIERDKSDINYKRFLMRIEPSEDGMKKTVVLYSWPPHDMSFPPILTEADQLALYSFDDCEKREVLLSDVKDFQVTGRLSNLYVNRIRYPRYEDIAVVKLYVQLGEKGGADFQYSNDFVFANKSIYGDIDGTFFVAFSSNNIVP